MTMGDISSRPSNLQSLTSLRFFAAALVLVCHGFYLLTPNTAFSTLTSVGFIGVGFFFTLSGFILTWTHNPDLPRRYFYGRRLARIYPLHILTAVAAVALIIAAGQAIDEPAAVLNLALLQSWVPVENYGASLNGVSWSLCCEAFFYLLFPFLVRWARKWDAATAIFIVAVASVAVAFMVAVLLPHEAAQQFLYKGPAFRIGSFIIGIILGVWVRRGGRLKVGVGAALIMLGISYVLALAATQVAVKAGLPDLRVYADLITLPATCVLIVAAARSDMKKASAWLRSPMLVLLGKASFALYMTHFLLLTAWVTFVGVPQNIALAVAEVAGLSLAAIVLSVGVYQWIEHPAEKFIRARIGTPRAAAHSTEQVAAARR